MYTIPRTQTITRGTIKRVETRLQGLSNLGQFDILSSTAVGSLKSLLDWITGRTGQLKITATEFAEGMVKVMYGLDPDCRMPSPGIPIVPMASPPRFCAGSIAGMIERCRLSDATASLNQVKTQFAERIRRDGSGNYIYEEGQFVKAWWDQYGVNDVSGLTAKITTAQATCGVGGGGPIITPIPVDGRCPTNFRFNPLTERCDYIAPGIETGISSQTLMILAAGAAIFLFAMKR